MKHELISIYKNVFNGDLAFFLSSLEMLFLPVFWCWVLVFMIKHPKETTLDTMSKKEKQDYERSLAERQAKRKFKV
jgi:hypothetical protein